MHYFSFTGLLTTHLPPRIRNSSAGTYREKTVLLRLNFWKCAFQSLLLSSNYIFSSFKEPLLFSLLLRLRLNSLRTKGKAVKLSYANILQKETTAILLQQPHGKIQNLQSAHCIHMQINISIRSSLSISFSQKCPMEQVTSFLKAQYNICYSHTIGNNLHEIFISKKQVTSLMQSTKQHL